MRQTVLGFGWNRLKSVHVARIARLEGVKFLNLNLLKMLCYFVNHVRLPARLPLSFMAQCA